MIVSGLRRLYLMSLTTVAMLRVDRDGDCD